ncbi:unnamed protein product [Chrysoparadoxa australica]
MKRKRESTNNSHVLRLKGCALFRQRIVSSVLSGKAIKLDAIRPMPSGEASESIKVGLLGFEASFLKLIDQLTNGSKAEISESGTSLSFQPGFIYGGKITHDCGTERSIGWFLEGILPLAPFSKKPIHMTLTGVTNDDTDMTVDGLKAISLPLLQRFGVAEEGGLELKVKHRGAPPLGGGTVVFTCPVVRKLEAITLTDPGLVKRVRGIAYSARVSPQIGNRVAEGSRGVLNRLLPDVWVHTDHHPKRTGGESPGFGLSLIAESTTGVLLGAESAAKEGVLPEDLGERTSRLLLEECGSGGCVDSTHQSLVLLLMVLCPEDVSSVRFGRLSQHTINSLRCLRTFFGVVFKIKPDASTSTVLLSCLGAGYQNMARGAT